MSVPLKIRNINPSSFRPGEWARILRTTHVGSKRLACYVVQYADGAGDILILCSDHNNYEIKPDERITVVSHWEFIDNAGNVIGNRFRNAHGFVNHGAIRTTPNIGRYRPVYRKSM